MITAVTMMTLLNITIAVWLVVSAIACLIHPPQNRDLRPLVLPIFCSLGFMFLKIQSLVVLATCESLTLQQGALIDRVVEAGFLVSLYLFVQGFKQKRCGRVDCHE